MSELDVLAVLTPHIGVISETFIKRHIEELHSQTIAIADSDYPPYAGNWDVQCPKHIIKKNNFLYTFLRKSSNRLRRYYAFDKKHIKAFLQEYQATRILGQYLDFSVRFLPLAEDLNIPFYAHAHGVDVSKRLRSHTWRREYQNLERAFGIITINQISKRELTKLGLPSRKIHVIPCGVHIPQQPILRTSAHQINCLAVGRMVAKKGPILLLDSFRKALQSHPNIKLNYVGSGQLLPIVEQYIKDFGLASKITLHGARSNAYVKELMKKSDIFIQHSVVDPETGDMEGLPVSILEAMAHSMPIVSTYHAGIPEAVVDTETGFLVREKDTTSMADKILTLAANQDLRNSMGLQGWARARDFFSWEREKNLLRNVMNLK